MAGGIGRNFISRDLLEAINLEDALNVRRLLLFTHKKRSLAKEKKKKKKERELDLLKIVSPLQSASSVLQCIGWAQLQSGRCTRAEDIECRNCIRQSLPRA